MKHFKEEIIRDIFNDAVVVTTKEHYYYASDSEKKQHKIDMINHGFEDSGQVVKKLRDISFLPSDWIHDSYVYYWSYIKQETMRKEKISDKSIYRDVNNNSTDSVRKETFSQTFSRNFL